jgi:hypothetical protein
MPMWRCPHCGTPQAETARCWVCQRSSTSCATCRHYRRSVAAQLGYCGLDPRRQPLTGDEIRGCWEGWPLGAPRGSTPPLTIAPAHATDERHRPLAFVEVDTAADRAESGDAPTPSVPGAVSAPAEPAWNLWGDSDR